MPLLTLPATVDRTSNLYYDGDILLFGKTIGKNTPFHKVLCVLDGLLEQLFKNDALDCIDLEALGIKCPDKNITRQCLIMQWAVENINANNLAVNNLIQNIQTIQTGIGMLKDEKVKVKAAGVAGYLETLIEAPASAITVTDNKISFLGFAPIGARFYINPNRIGDFDGTGKGKVDTDMWGYAIRNGNNGLDNALGLFPMHTDTLANVGITGGASSFTVSKTNISSFSIPVTGLIQDALGPIKFKVGWRHYRSFDGTDGVGNPIKDFHFHNGDSEWFTEEKNLIHSHGFNLNVAHNNATPTPIPLVPKHIKELPIERIIP